MYVGRRSTRNNDQKQYHQCTKIKTSNFGSVSQIYSSEASSFSSFSSFISLSSSAA